jgi:hypothetical protein
MYIVFVVFVDKLQLCSCGGLTAAHSNSSDESRGCK